MTLIGLSGIKKSFGGRLVLDGLELEVGERARIGVLGRNGTGKTTLFRLITGPDTPDAGAVARKKDLRLALLPSRCRATSGRRSRRCWPRAPT